jgi:lipopolysaccharide/colanic/teichoic acid biosynthesis glycosyltransferase
VGEDVLVGRGRSIAATIEPSIGEAIRSHLSTRAQIPNNYAVVKRVTDIVLGLIGLLISLPMMVVIAIVVRVDSPGPIIFRQVRVGVSGRPFFFYKFRTMHSDARRRFPELYAYRYTDAEIETMRFKILDDPRLTRVGRHLRKTSLDELPNFINVVLGDMSLVGPRPELPEMLRYYRPEQLTKFSVRPGVTGLAQIRGRGVLKFQDTIAADLEYVRTMRLKLDLTIMIRTAVVVVRRVGAF